MPVPNRQIRDLASFDEHTSGRREVAGLYAYKHLDCLVTLAHHVARDFFARPHMYRQVGDDAVGRDLARLYARYGNDDEFLGAEQREAVFGGCFGAMRQTTSAADSGGDGSCADDFDRLRGQLLAAAVAFAERVFDTSVQLLRDRVRIMHVGLKNYLDDVSGASVHWSRTAGLPAITEATSYRVLRNPRIAAVFGVAQPPGDDWPYREDPNGTKLVEEMSRQLSVGARTYTRESFIRMQRLALRGAEAIAAVIDFDDGDPDDAVDMLAGRCYTWYAADGQALGTPLAMRSDGNRSMYATPSSELAGVIS